uniref:3 transmembrane helices protein n=1 Tax=Pithovirus LCPAC302 TaxID=2506593 RepID=A0A481Z6A6_9VIRU|nr:MAG: 3 transmembrane helices protein [Pithovirus LCPAC302]
MLWLILFVGLIVVLLVYWEYSEHDCLPHKSCKNSVPKPRKEDDPLVYIDKIRGMVRNNFDFVSWRLALLAGIIAALPIVYYLECRIPTLFEWIVVGGLIFIAAYLSNSWIWAHFFHPNGAQIEKSLIELRDKIQKLTYTDTSFYY